MASVSDLQQPRAKPRLKLFQPTVIHHEGAEGRAHLLDLSATGAQVHAASPPASGAVIRIGCGGALRRARVIWERGGRFGIIFATPLTPAEIDQALAGTDG